MICVMFISCREFVIICATKGRKVMYYKKSGFILNFKLAVYTVLVVMMFSSGIYLGISAVSAYRADQLRATAESIDHSLFLYSQSHKKLDPDSIYIVEQDSKQHIKSKSKPVYPADLTEIGIVQTKFGYISELITFTNTVSASDLKGIFHYEPVLDPDGECTAYNLRVRLPNGEIYISPGSKEAK